MHIFKTALVSALVVFSLSACDEQKVVQKEVENKIEEFTTPKPALKPPPEPPEQEDSKVTYEKTKDENKVQSSDLYGFWVSSENYLMISAAKGQLHLRKFIKNEKEEDLGLFIVLTANENRLLGSFSDNVNDPDNMMKFEFNDTKDEFTLETPNQKPIKYKATTLTPYYYQESFDS